jgi:DNA-binding CsgD family transcriptional regulator/tetratricopeptide (TPR) repeat protein
MLRYCAKALLSQGERARAEDLWRQLRELAERTQVATVHMYAAVGDFELAMIDGHLEDAWERFNRIVDQADELGMSVHWRPGRQSDLTLSLYLGRANAWLAAFDQNVGPVTVVQPGRQSANSIRLTAGRALCLAQIGRPEEAQTLVAPLLDNIEGMDDELPIGPLALLLQSAVVVEHRVAAQGLAGRLACVAHLNGDTLMLVCVARHLGDTAALVGDRTAARGYYAQALESTRKIRFRPELALTHVRLAEFLLQDGEDAEALEHLEGAIPELQDMKMQPGLERALSLLQQIEHRAPAPTSGAEGSQVLTGREREVAGLLATGRSNREIADMLVITEGTVEVHVKHILSKLGLRSRAQVAAWAADERF